MNWGSAYFLVLVYCMVGIGAGTASYVDCPSEVRAVQIGLMWPALVGVNQVTPALKLQCPVKRKEPDMDKDQEDRKETIQTLDQQAGVSEDVSERDTLKKAADILRKRHAAHQRGPGGMAGAPVDDKLTRD